jgi:hypothetical protein
VTLRPTGEGGETHTWTLRCDPPGGTHPDPGAACSALASLERPFAETPPDMACTELYGGPATAHVTGTFAGETIDTTFGRADGCEIDRWGLHEALIDPERQAGGAGGT